jgi:hypothetical protein
MHPRVAQISSETTSSRSDLALINAWPSPVFQAIGQPEPIPKMLREVALRVIRHSLHVCPVPPFVRLGQFIGVRPSFLRVPETLRYMRVVAVR